MKRAEHWCRYFMNRALEDYVGNTKYQAMSVLEISGSKWADFGFRNYRSVNFPDFDICKKPLAEKFDLVIAEQVFEHIRYPNRAARHVYKMLKPQGTFVISTPFLIKYHPVPEDLWRWSKEGLEYFLEDSGFVNVETSSWGNKQCVVANLDSWAGFSEEEHSLENQEEYPLVVWGFASRGTIGQKIRRLYSGHE